MGKLQTTIESELGVRLNRNQFRDIERIIFEITRRENCLPGQIIEYLKERSQAHRCEGKEKFTAIKKTLINRRFPETALKEEISFKNVFLSEIPKHSKPAQTNQKEFRPLKIIIEKEAKESKLAANFTNKFPQAQVEIIERSSQYLEKEKFDALDFKKPIIFIVKEKRDFIKPCPCANNHLSCGYWILNIGFGCPFDCSYCFLQAYTNFPGIILPANLEDFFHKFDDFNKKLKSPIRIGTGEFCDSLALDDITGYSSQLIDYFKDKNVFFELKTKSVNITNLLDTKPAKNIVISWSVNPQEIAETEEPTAPGLYERLKAASTLQEKGYRIGFHFDPVIYSREWRNIYEKTIEEIYRRLKPPFAWISIGTLRGNRKLKTACEQRFPKSNIFYGELFFGEDKKLRYPQFLRRQIYQNMVKWIRQRDEKTPVYLCMENKISWKEMGDDFLSPGGIEKYIIKANAI